MQHNLKTGLTAALNYVNDYNHHYLTKITCYLKCTSQRITPVIALASNSLWQKRKFLLFSVVLFSFFLPVFAQENLPITISGIVKIAVVMRLLKLLFRKKVLKWYLYRCRWGLYSKSGRYKIFACIFLYWLCIPANSSQH